MTSYVDSRENEVQRAKEDEFLSFEKRSAFFILKSSNNRIDYSPQEFVRIADKSIRQDSGSGTFSLLDDGQPSSPVIDFLTGIFDRVCSRVNNLTAVVEVSHVDLAYRDLYYAHYSKNLFEVGRFTTRITLFEKVLTADSFTNSSDKELSEVAIGSVVLCPINRGIVGRTLFSPKYIADFAGGIVDLRLSKFSITVRGKRIKLNSFTYRQQDNEVMSCAEVSLLNLMCYYSNEYNDYAVTTPSEILALEEFQASERVTPTRGLSFYDMSKILTGLRFYPRVYNSDDMASILIPLGLQISKTEWMNRLLSWYIGSGIPLAAHVADGDGRRTGHSIVVMGKTEMSDEKRALTARYLADNGEAIDDACKRAIRLSRRVYEGGQATASDVEWDFSKNYLHGRKSCRIVNAADFDEVYAVMDDACLPYASWSPFGSLSRDGKVPQALLVPLHRSMVLDAIHAHENGMTVLENGKAGVLNWAREDIEDGEQIVVKMFMCSARGYKRSRAANHPEFASVYEEMVLPHFLWVFELYRVNSYFVTEGEKCAFAELVIGTTSAGFDNPMSKVVFMRYPRRMYLRWPDGSEKYLPIAESVSKKARRIIPYERNLVHVKV